MRHHLALAVDLTWVALSAVAAVYIRDNFVPYESHLEAVETETKSKRDIIISNADTLEQEAGKNREYELLLTETVADGSLTRTQQDRRDIESAIPAAKKELVATEEQPVAIQRECRMLKEEVDSEDK